MTSEMDNGTDVTTVKDRIIDLLSAESMVANGIDLYLPPFLFITGLVCNTLVILVMRAPYFAKVSTSLYMSFNALIDNVSILMVLPVHWLHVNFPYVIYRGSHSDFICKALNFIGWGTSDLGIILTSSMTLERAIAIKFPLQSLSLCTVKKAKYVIGCLIVVILLKDGIFLVSSVMVPLQDETQLCDLDKSNSNIRKYSENFLPVIHNIFLSISFVVIIVSNMVILQSVKSSERFPTSTSTMRAKGVGARAPGQQTSSQQENNDDNFKMRRSSRGRQLTIMLISDSLTIVICTLPFSIVTSVDLGHKNDGTSHLVFAISLYLLYVNRCANFFLYCISGERFRRGLKQICTCTKRKTSYIHTSTYAHNLRQEPAVRTLDYLIDSDDIQTVENKTISSALPQ